MLWYVHTSFPSAGAVIYQQQRDEREPMIHDEEEEILKPSVCTEL